ncbi:Cytochrome C oxidase Cbb3 [uncultured Defluviicoccus sp.]|uniref:Cytochrome C oxidase Cbb3 n=1 Tax=metagenome TaxID=256318 RepID=A0A380TC99_9ZZZZ|nr:Cytochrome C oxidase Cbb3 [uncultured Defluviicoccus sp.]
MRRLLSSALLTVAAALSFTAEAAEVAPGAAAGGFYQQHCASCHGADRLGGTGPALIPESLQRLRREEAARTITHGRAATQMPAFADLLSPAETAALVALIYQPLAEPPTWSVEQMRASRIIHTPAAELPAAPVHDADPLNLFTVVEAGDQHVTILDGDRLQPLWRFPSRFALHGGAKYSPDGRFVYLGSRDGWVSKYDLYGLTPVAEIRAGINLRNIAVAADGRTVAVGNYLPPSLVILDAGDLTPLKLVEGADKLGTPSRISAVYTARPRHGFIVALKDAAEMWEVSYRADPEPVARGLVHNYEPGMLEGMFDTGPFPVRRIALDDVLDDFFFDPDYRNAIGAARNARAGQVINLNVGRKVADLALNGMPHLASGITFAYEGRTVLATPLLNEPAIAVFDIQTWQPVRRITTAGPGFFLRSHENTPYAWTDTSLGSERDQIQIIDKRTLEIVRTLRPAPGRLTSHVEFSRDGRHALVSVSEMDGALVVYDAERFVEVKRLPMHKPSGKYNVFNKINLSAGTSH